jgi:hypothetical protein
MIHKKHERGHVNNAVNLCSNEKVKYLAQILDSASIVIRKLQNELELRQARLKELSENKAPIKPDGPDAEFVRALYIGIFQKNEKVSYAKNMITRTVFCLLSVIICFLLALFS